MEDPTVDFSKKGSRVLVSPRSVRASAQLAAQLAADLVSKGFLLSPEFKAKLRAQLANLRVICEREGVPVPRGVFVQFMPEEYEE